jgi:hypothetical protein
MSALRRLEAADLRAVAETFPAELEALAIEHAATGLVLIHRAGAKLDGQPVLHLGGDAAALVSELIRLARIGAYAEAQAHAFPHAKIRTVVRQAPGAR